MWTLQPHSERLSGAYLPWDNWRMVFTATLDPWSFLKTEAVPLTVITAILGVIFAVLNLMKLASDSQERTRPYIALEPRLGVHLNGAIDLVVTNYGQSPAQKVVIRPLEKLDFTEDDYILPLLNNFFGRQLYLAPGASFRIMWRTVKKGRIKGVPETLHVEVSYESTKKNRFKRSKKYKEILVVDTGFTVAAPEPTPGGKTNDPGTQVEKSLKNIDLALRALNQHIANRS